MLWAIAGVLALLWLVAFFGGIGGSLAHVLLVAALAIITFKVVSGWRRRT
jgi:Family of unknown function (DUF5670)